MSSVNHHTFRAWLCWALANRAASTKVFHGAPRSIWTGTRFILSNVFNSIFSTKLMESHLGCAYEKAVNVLSSHADLQAPDGERALWDIEVHKWIIFTTYVSVRTWCSLARTLAPVRISRCVNLPRRRNSSLLLTPTCLIQPSDRRQRSISLTLLLYLMRCACFSRR